MTPDLLLPLSQAGDVQQCGGKAAGLHWLLAQGCVIPEGVVIPVAVFTAHVADWGIAIEKTAPDFAAQCSQLQQTIRESPLSTEFIAALRHFWQHQQQTAPDIPLAVRSSAPGEDGQNASFAGQFDSVLHITDFDALQQAIRQVWASTFNPHALLYAQHHQQTLNTMAVIIQQQVDATISGVLFTQNPAGNGAEELLIEYCEGLADRLVAGEITPVSVVVEREDWGEGSNACLPALNQLAHQALKLEQAAGKPLDIEWSIDQQQQLYFVQCRPMTTVVPAQDTPPTPPTTELWSNANMAENFPDPVVPLLASFVPRGYAGYFRGLGAAFGIAPGHMDKAKDAFDRLVGLQGGRLYYNLSQIFTVIHLVPGGAWLAQSFNLFTGAEGSPVPQRYQLKGYQQLWQGLKIAYHVPRQFLWIKQRVAAFERMIDDYAATTRPDDLRQQTPVELSRHLRDFLAIRLNRWSNAALADTAAMVCYAALKALIKRWLPNADAQLHNDLLQGLPGLASARPVEELWQLSTRIQRQPEALALFSKHSAAKLIHILPQQAPETWQDIQHYLQRWGFRYSGELMLIRETPAENPEAVLLMLQSYLDDIGFGPRYYSCLRAVQREETSKQLAEQLTPRPLLRKLPLPTRAAIFQRLLHATHGAIRLRERARMKQALLYTRLRHVCLALGDQLVQRGWLEQRNDVFYLEIDEAITLAESAACFSDSKNHHTQQNNAMQTLQQKITQRRAAMAHNLTLNPPQQMTLPVGEAWHPGISASSGVSDHVAPDKSDGNILSGMSACGGQVSGTAAVLTDVTQINTLTAGSILVTQQTDPGWAPVFFLVKGLVIERGGMLSHGAIIAREYGIPAVVGVAQATQLIKDGEALMVDGTLGRVVRGKSPNRTAGKRS